MQHSLNFKEDRYHFDIEALKQYSLMHNLDYTYLCILLQRARFSAIKAGQRLRAKYEADHIIYIIKGSAVINNEGSEFYVDDNFKSPLFEKDSHSEALFTDESFIIRIERPLYEIFNKSNLLNRVV